MLAGVLTCHLPTKTSRGSPGGVSQHSVRNPACCSSLNSSLDVWKVGVAKKAGLLVPPLAAGHVPSPHLCSASQINTCQVVTGQGKAKAQGQRRGRRCGAPSHPCGLLSPLPQGLNPATPGGE